mmetsp:Transcript_29229/g.84531  ORF Transcript_29229/g.84531 Transcript_29229/m.84531 type:complete len:208 (-) Transcript_29229:2251-2874(-)
MDTDDGGAAGGRPCVDVSGCRDVLHKIHSGASQIASDAERAEHIIATHTDDNSQDGVSLTDAHSACNELAQMSSDRETHRMEGDGRLFRCIHRVGGAVESLVPVPVGDGGKRACVAIESAAAAAATANSKAATPRPMNKPKKYGRPCLCGLPGRSVKGLTRHLSLSPALPSGATRHLLCPQHTPNRQQAHAECMHKAYLPFPWSSGC